ncbi:hypothetical protein D7D52_25985 [Nocardia yunnanensis]|uniref:Secreted protein n=1 Tax=Nocardia yunnanensis TaxID=2382165 RepID=A0A386ZPV0_9NOCA|nr:hypothetical protein [Nocardia yunnanensis]AYF79393.1 hypothetical protein D7D52_25985 [Nocardia yunnanensis]
MTTARITAALAAALVISGAVAIGPAATPARAYGPASCVPGNPTQPTGELFATTNTDTITDPNDPRLSDPLSLFELEVDATAATELALPVGSQLVDGVFWSSDSGTTTYERSRQFQLACTDYKNLCWVADDLRVRHNQESVLTFEYLPGDDTRANGFTVTVPGVDRTRFHDALVADPVVRDRLGGGSVTQDGALILVADRADLNLVRDFVTSLGAAWDPASVVYGAREFVHGTGTSALACSL